MHNLPPDRPEGLIPCDPLNPENVTLQASAFVDPDGDGHLETQFQLIKSAASPRTFASAGGEFVDPDLDLWIRFENWYAPPGASGRSNGYFSINTVVDPDITRVQVELLEPKSKYVWRVRYRDKGLAWSPWSIPISFITRESILGPNLLDNPGGEDGVSGWTVVDPPLESLVEGQCGADLPPLCGLPALT